MASSVGKKLKKSWRVGTRPKRVKSSEVLLTEKSAKCRTNPRQASKERKADARSRPAPPNLSPCLRRRPRPIIKDTLQHSISARFGCPDSPPASDITDHSQGCHKDSSRFHATQKCTVLQLSSPSAHSQGSCFCLLRRQSSMMAPAFMAPAFPRCLSVISLFSKAVSRQHSTGRSFCRECKEVVKSRRLRIPRTARPTSTLEEKNRKVRIGSPRLFLLPRTKRMLSPRSSVLPVLATRFHPGAGGTRVRGCPAWTDTSSLTAICCATQTASSLREAMRTGFCRVKN